MTRIAPTLALLAALTASCGGDDPAGVLSESALEAVSEADGGVGGRSAFQPPASPSFYAVDDAGKLAPIPTPHELWFGDSGWDCCTRRLCAGLCDGGDIPVQDPTGMRVCCVPDIQQCDGAWPADDAGL